MGIPLPGENDPKRTSQASPESCANYDRTRLEKVALVGLANRPVDTQTSEHREHRRFRYRPMTLELVPPRADSRQIGTPRPVAPPRIYAFAAVDRSPSRRLRHRPFPSSTHSSARYRIGWSLARIDRTLDIASASTRRFTPLGAGPTLMKF